MIRALPPAFRTERLLAQRLEQRHLDDLEKLYAEPSVGPGGEFLSRPYTRAHYRDLWRPPLFDNTLYEQWRAEGGTTLSGRLETRTRELLESREPVVSPETAAEIDRLWAASG